jgi:hypothetical protein
MELSYSCHLGTDRNKSKRGSRAAKNSISGTSSLSNHSIQNMNQLGHVLKHDLRLEEYNNENIVMVIGESQDKETAMNHIKNIYKNEINDIINSNLFKKMKQGFFNNNKTQELCRKCNFYELRR